MYQLNDVSYNAHNEETNTDSLTDLKEFSLVRLCASVQELCAIFYKVPRDLGELLELV